MDTEISKNDTLTEQKYSTEHDPTAFPPNIFNNKDEMRMFMFGWAGFLLLLAGLTALSIGAYQMLILWKLNINVSRFMNYAILILTALFIIQSIIMVIDIEKKKATAGQVVKVFLSMIFIITMLVCTSAPHYFKLFYVALSNIILGASMTITGFYLHYRSKGSFFKLLKEMSSQKRNTVIHEKEVK